MKYFDNDQQSLIHESFGDMDITYSKTGWFAGQKDDVKLAMVFKKDIFLGFVIFDRLNSTFCKN